MVIDFSSFFSNSFDFEWYAPITFQSFYYCDQFVLVLKIVEKKRFENMICRLAWVIIISDHISWLTHMTTLTDSDSDMERVRKTIIHPNSE